MTNTFELFKLEPLRKGSSLSLELISFLPNYLAKLLYTQYFLLKLSGLNGKIFLIKSTQFFKYTNVRSFMCDSKKEQFALEV